MQVYLGLISALFLSMFLVPPLIYVSGPLGLVDRPDARKSHTGIIPRVGGLAIAAGTLVPVALWLTPLSAEMAGFLVAAVIIVLFGLLDDRFDLDYRIKFLAQFAAIGVVVVSGVNFDHLPLFGLDTAPPAITIPVTIVFLLAVTNAFNLLDGLDGLAAGCAVLSLAGVAALAYSCGATEPMLLALLAIGGILGFLRYNTHPAIVFMGDAGSQFLGFTIGVATILVLQKASATISPAVAAFLIGLPLLDTVSVMVQRLREGRSPFSPDRNHVHHKLLSLGFLHQEAVIAIYVIQAVMIVLAFVMRAEADGVVITTYLVIAGALVGAFAVLRWSSFRLHQIRDEIDPGAMRAFLTPQRRERLLRLSANYIEWSVAAYLIIAAFGVKPVSTDIGIGCLAFAFFIFAGAMLYPSVRPVMARVAVYTAAAIAAYMSIFEGGSDWLSGLQMGVFLSTTVLAIGAAIYLLSRQQFQLTSLDLLIFLLAISVLLAPLPAAEKVLAAAAAARFLIAVYACEVLLSLQPARVGILGVAATMALVLLGVGAFQHQASFNIAALIGEAMR
ncbi:MAG: undecaprenyl/decaprenyl-phosphate alpha-N-acetylglucosaminyl 1-phosphate transferase [Alphaproteobacteria bacterium]|nr:undecaprenyl/decaprenyl-phosphate alpha-N-acetylglucosaminyl 1-phosphate transferase [Alphaproteobacteria bacterium]